LELKGHIPPEKLNYKDAMATLTDTQFSLIILGAMLIIAVSALGLFWVSRRYPPTRKSKADPLFKAFYIWIVLLLGYGIIVLLGIRTQENAKADIKWLILSLFVLILFYALVSYFVNKPIPSYRLWKEYVLPNVKQYWGAEPYAGAGYFSGMIFHKVIELERSPMIKLSLQEMGKTADKIDVFYGQAYMGNMFPFLAGVNKYTGEDLLLARPPILTIALMQNFLGEELVSSFTPELSKYGNEEEHIAQPEKRMTVQK